MSSHPPFLTPGEYLAIEISDPHATLHLVSVDCHVEVAAIYEKIEFQDASG
jgi:hypothetical protein